MLDCGLRLNEVTSLKIDNLHLEEKYMIIDGKGGKQRIIPFGSMSFKALVNYLSVRPSARGSLFLTRLNKPIRPHEIKQIIHTLKFKSGINRLKPHLLRHTFATLYLENGGNIYTLQALLGHTSLEMVKIYLHLCKNKVVHNFSKYSPLDNLLTN